MRSTLAALTFLLVGTAVHSTERAPTPVWHEQYRDAIAAATTQQRQLLLWFFDPQAASANEPFEKDVLAQPAIARAITERFVAARLPLDARISWEAEPTPLVAHASFAALQQRAGLAIVELSDPEGPHYRHVVSVYPFSHGLIGAEKLLVLLDLPRGSLTQRTLIFAVRTHPEQPASVASHLSRLLTQEAASHAAHQARINLQGHHLWEQRFHAINAQLPPGFVAQEVCAESWPGQGLLEAAEECVASWRQSPGHWDAVSRRHALFGYDMQLGTSGVWYATGIFAAGK